ncbi:UNVERIFIED_CONTAM: hypothetical protein K2H54_061818 [Gekko kuhli]
MNKTPQPSGGTPSAPHPSPSPGLPQQSAFPPGQPASVVFNPAQATQMNTPSQPRQFGRGQGKAGEIRSGVGGQQGARHRQ